MLSQDELLASLSTGGIGEQTAASSTYAPAPPLSESLPHFWQFGAELETVPIHIAKSEVPYPLLDRLGDPDFMPEARRWLTKAYDMVAETAVQTAYGTDSL